jgi:Na+/proline symporter
MIMSLVYASFTILSGAKGVMVNDTIMFFLFSIATYLAFPFIIKSAGGVPDAITKAAHLPSRPDFLCWHGITGPHASMGIPWKALAWAVIMGLVWVTISIITIYLFPHISISTIATIKADIAPSEKVFIWAAMNLVPKWLGVVFGEILKSLGINLPVYLNPVIIGVVLSTVTLFAVSAFGTVTDAERASY